MKNYNKFGRGLMSRRWTIERFEGEIQIFSLRQWGSTKRCWVWEEIGTHVSFNVDSVPTDVE